MTSWESRMAAKAAKRAGFYGMGYDNLAAIVNALYDVNILYDEEQRGIPKLKRMRWIAKELNIDWDVVWEMVGWKDYFQFLDDYGDDPKYFPGANKN